MAFKLTKEEIAKRDEIFAALNEKYAELETAVGEYNEAVGKAQTEVENVLAEYNKVLADARELAQDIANDADSEMMEKSEKWADSDAGQAAQAFKDEWEGLNLDDLEIEFPGELVVEDPGHAE